MSEEVKEYELNKKEKEEIRNMCAEVTAIHKYMTDKHLGDVFKDDAERFIGITAFHTRNLISHSIKLTTLTGWLIGLTISLAIIAIMQILFILATHFKWI